MRVFTVMLAIVSFLCGAVDAAGAPGSPIHVKLLYDNSGSMFPGYKPPGAADRRTRAELNVRYIHEYPAFQQWLADFVKLQTVVDAGSVEMWTFTSQGAFSPADLRQVHPRVPVAQFSVDRAVRSFPEHQGQTTHLVESLQAFTNNFTGLVWLITDNVVETSAGVPDTGVDDFFRMLDRDERFRSVHLFKLPFADAAAGQQSALAVYGLIVSPAAVPADTLAWYDRKFRTNLRFANRTEGTPPPQLFPGREHLKLKDLSVDALELRAVPNLKLLIDDPERSHFKEGQTVKLELSGEIKSYLTQHSVTAGRYRLQLATPFTAEDTARRQLGLQPLAPEEFDAHSDEIRQPIAPNGQRDVKAVLQSSRPVSFSPTAPGSWLRLALNGARVRYTGTVRMSFEDVEVRLEPAQMQGIFGIERASAVFRLQDIRRLPSIQPSMAQVGFTLETGPNRSVVLLLILAVLAAIAGVIGYLLSRKQWYRVRTSNSPVQVIALRRFGRHTIRHEDRLAGALTRNLFGDYGFAPAAGVTAKGGIDGAPWDLRFRDGANCQVTIEPVGGKQHSAPQKKDPRAAVPPPPAQNAPPSVRRPLPKIDRP